MKPQPVIQSSLVVQTPGVCGGRARLNRTRIAVWVLVSLQRQGADSAEIAAIYPQLPIDQIESALVWAEQHADQIAVDLAEAAGAE